MKTTANVSAASTVRWQRILCILQSWKYRTLHNWFTCVSFEKDSFRNTPKITNTWCYQKYRIFHCLKNSRRQRFLLDILIWHQWFFFLLILLQHAIFSYSVHWSFNVCDMLILKNLQTSFYSGCRYETRSCIKYSRAVQYLQATHMRNIQFIDHISNTNRCKKNGLSFNLKIDFSK